MKQYIKQYSIWLLVGLVTLLASCSKELQRGEQPQQSTNLGDGVALTVCFPQRTLVGSPSATPSRSLRGSTIGAQEYEQSLQEEAIFFLLFEDNGAGQIGRLKRVEQVKELSNGLPENGVTGKLYIRDSGVFYVLPTANIRWSKADRDKLLGLSFEEVSKYIVKQPAGEHHWFPMAGEPVKVDTSTLGSSPLNFYLERLSVRIDLVNETSDDKGGRFELTGARLRKGNIDRSFLVKGQVPALTIGDLTYAAGEVISNNWIERDGTINSDPNHMCMQLYTYENVENTLYIEVKGTFKGEKAVFELPFRPAPKRNTLYRVALRNTKTTDVPIEDPTQPLVEPGITVLDWTEGGVATLSPERDMSQPVIVSMEPATDATKHEVILATADDINTLQAIKLTSPERYQVRLKLHSKGSKPMLLAQNVDIPWVSVEPIGKAQISTEGLTQEYLISFAANADLFPRTAELEIQNRHYPDKITPRHIQITQAGTTDTKNQLAYWAKANVDELNTFATEVTGRNYISLDVIGKFYQWGRNVAFPYGTYKGQLEFTTTKPGYNEPLVWDKKIIKISGRPEHWSREPLQGGDTWTSIVAKAASAPAWYKGTNDGDPSPNGYRLPTYGEMCLLFPTAILSAKDVFGKSLSCTSDLYNCSVRGESNMVEVRDKYFSDGQGTLYALKLMSDDHKYLTAFRYEKNHFALKVSAVYLGEAGATLGIEDIAKASFWDSNVDNVVVRYFPTRGAYHWRDDNEVFAYYRASAMYYSSDVLLSGGSTYILHPRIIQITVHNKGYNTVNAVNLRPVLK